jgi:hypothetical protein
MWTDQWFMIAQNKVNCKMREHTYPTPGNVNENNHQYSHLQKTPCFFTANMHESQLLLQQKDPNY